MNHPIHLRAVVFSFRTPWPWLALLPSLVACMHPPAQDGPRVQSQGRSPVAAPMEAPSPVPPPHTAEPALGALGSLPDSQPRDIVPDHILRLSPQGPTQRCGDAPPTRLRIVFRNVGAQAIPLGTPLAVALGGFTGAPNRRSSLPLVQDVGPVQSDRVLARTIDPGALGWVEIPYPKAHPDLPLAKGGWAEVLLDPIGGPPNVPSLQGQNESGVARANDRAWVAVR